MPGIFALIRGWVLQGLASEQGMSLQDRIDRLAADADRLRRLAAATLDVVRRRRRQSSVRR
jgi:hypothetical protein